MKKEYIIGGLALLGVIGVISYLSKPKRNSEGFFGATGGRYSTLRPKTGNCAVCKTENETYYRPNNRICSGRDICVTHFG